MENVKHRVLLVEDTPIARKVAIIVLNSLNCNIDVAEMGTVALEMATKNKYDLILMDIGLPDIDGLSVAKQIRQHEPSGQHVPIVALTAQGESLIKDKLLESGLDDYLIKPLTMDNGLQLLEKINCFYASLTV